MDALQNRLELEVNDAEFMMFSAPTQAQGYLYEPRRDTGFILSDDSSSAESDDDDSAAEFDERLGNNNWCECGGCVPMPTSMESTCCREIAPVCNLSDDLELRCITEHPGFHGNCINEYVVETSFYEFLEGYGHVGDDAPVHKLYRHVAYRRFTRWVWHILGKGVRKVIPSCAVKKIRDSWPSEEFTGFRYKRQ